MLACGLDVGLGRMTRGLCFDYTPPNPQAPPLPPIRTHPFSLDKWVQYKKGQCGSQAKMREAGGRGEEGGMGEVGSGGWFPGKNAEGGGMVRRERRT